MKTLLFDLDGTLLPLNLEEFIQRYMVSITTYCAKIVPPQEFARALWASTEKMLQNPGRETNEAVFMASFLAKLELSAEEIYPILDKYYTHEFPKLRQFVQPTLLSPQVLEECLASGWQLVLATNPVFPRKAIEARMEWAGITGFPWAHVTTYENSRGCKPSLGYYQGILDKLRLEPQECWMIGNDAEEDMVAKRLGIRTYLITDYLITKGNHEYQTDGKGSLEDFLHFVRNKKLEVY